jgi:hypothetical protein
MKSKFPDHPTAQSSDSLGPGPRFDFSPENPALAIAELIGRHRGAASAITIQGIVTELWPTLWYLSIPDSKDNPDYPYRRKLQRKVKKWVGRLVVFGDEIIVSNRGHRNPGYFVPQTKKEIDDAVRTYIRQIRAMAARTRKLTGDSRYEELAGQLALLPDKGDPQITQKAEI